MSYTAEAFQNEYLALGAREVNAIVTVTSTGATGGVRTAGATEIIIVDASGSMQAEGRIGAARQAAKAAVECIDDGVHFAIIAGVSTAQQLYPDPGQLAVASPESRAAALRSIDRLQASGGTAMGAWLLLAAQLFAQRPGDIAHAMLRVGPTGAAKLDRRNRRHAVVRGLKARVLSSEDKARADAAVEERFG